MRLVLLAPLATAIVLIAGCGGASKSQSPTVAATSGTVVASAAPAHATTVPATPTPSASRAASAVASPSVTPSPRAATASASPTALPTVSGSAAGAAGPGCQTSQLQLDNYDGMGLRAATIKSMQFSLINASDKACDAGSFSVQLVDAAGAQLPTRTIFGSSDPGFDQFPYTFTLPPGALLDFSVEWNSVALKGRPCPVASTLQLTLWQSTSSLALPLPEGQVAPCNGGTLTLSPLLPGRGVAVPAGVPTPQPKAAGPQRCTTAQLAITLMAEDGAAGTVHDTFSMTNVWAGACTLYGYVGAQMLDAQGKPLPTTVVRGQGTASIDDLPQHFTLLPGASATFVAEFSRVPQGNEKSCPSAARLEVTPPDETTFQTIPLPADVFAPCNAGTFHVSPVRTPQ